ncbi:LTA synthase family protein [Paenibacillus polymyxa]|uniref:LTA synthase family protein n=1 Tax=Paenibacillus polymyxa TaxID=1406 RepID=UPI002ED361A4|nr:sulfatase-like hydrolase/transferase [Paenibacillus polymyxa]
MQRKMYILLTTLFLITFASGRFLLIAKKNFDYSLFDILKPTIIDILFAVLLILLCYWLGKLNRLLPYVIAISSMLFYFANIEYIYAMDNILNLSDISYISDSEFLKGSALHVSFPVYYILVVLFLIGALIFGNQLNKGAREGENKKLSVIFLVVLICSEGVLVSLSDNDWKNNNFVYASLNNGVYTVMNNEKDYDNQYYPENIEEKINTTELIGEGKDLLSHAAAGRKNVLIVTMEGIPGAYVAQTQKHLNVVNSIKMNSFNKIKDHSIIIPNYITHNNQTIRGLYSFLAGDYPKLDASTPKAYEYMEDSKNQKKLLPQLLKDKGYNTAYIQAAGLEFMSKDQFMKSAGFDTVIGSEGFPHNEVPFSWGVDDKAFFEQTESYLNDLNSKGKPWFATLLTVGTHHPYAVPPDYEEKYPDRKEAAVKYLDDSLSSFIDYINHSDFANDTLVLFVSDESHGVNDQPYGSNWGLCIAYAPNIEGTIYNDNVFGHKDILNSVLDYVDSKEYSNKKGRSIFRTYGKDSPIMFATHVNGDVFYSTEKGKVYKLDSKNNLYEIDSENHEMFSENYTIKKINDESLKNDISLYKNYISKPSSDNNELNIIKSKTYEVKAKEGYLITAGQYMTLPDKSYVNIDFNYELLDTKEGVGLTFELRTNEGKVIKKTVDGATSNKHLHYRFFNDKEQSGYTFEMFMTPFFSDTTSTKKVSIDNMVVSFEDKDKELKKGQSDATEFDVFKKGDEETNKNLIPFMSTSKSGVFLTSDNRILLNSKDSNNYLVYGPYLPYPKGKYTLQYKFKLNEKYGLNEPLFTLDVSAQQGSQIPAQRSFTLEDLDYEGGYYIAKLEFELNQDISDVEFRLHGNRSLDMTVTDVSTTKK